MTIRLIKTEQQRELLIKYVQNRRLPFSADISEADIRSNKQNALQHMWLRELEDQGDNTAEEYRGYCKLHFGVAIMKAESLEWAEKYDRIIKPLDYAKKLEMMIEPMDFPVTRLMSPKGAMQYLDKIYQHFTGLGFCLTDPSYQGIELHPESQL
jgi:hypothetical protein